MVEHKAVKKEMVVIELALATVQQRETVLPMHQDREIVLGKLQFIEIALELVLLRVTVLAMLQVLVIASEMLLFNATAFLEAFQTLDSHLVKKIFLVEMNFNKVNLVNPHQTSVKQRACSPFNYTFYTDIFHILSSVLE